MTVGEQERGLRFTGIVEGHGSAVLSFACLN